MQTILVPSSDRSRVGGSRQDTLPRWPSTHLHLVPLAVAAAIFLTATVAGTTLPSGWEAEAVIPLLLAATVATLHALRHTDCTMGGG